MAFFGCWVVGAGLILTSLACASSARNVASSISRECFRDAACGGLCDAVLGHLTGGGCGAADGVVREVRRD